MTKIFGYAISVISVILLAIVAGRDLDTTYMIILITGCVTAIIGMFIRGYVYLSDHGKLPND